MSNRLTARTACKIAWRESRASSAKFLFVILAVATGVGSLTGVRGFSRAFHDLLLREAVIRFPGLPDVHHAETVIGRCGPVEDRPGRQQWPKFDRGCPPALRCSSISKYADVLWLPY